MSEAARMLLQRALAAEDRVEELAQELADVRSRLKGVIGADPTTAVAALGWIHRCEQAEKLIAEIIRYLDQHSLHSTDLPDGWEARARAQTRAAQIAQRDEEGFKRPDGDDYWETYSDDRGRTGIINRKRDG